MSTIYERKVGPFQICLTIFFAIVCLLVLLPILNIVATSFSGKDAIAMGKVGLLPVDFNADAYKMVITDAGMVRSFFFSFFPMSAT